MSTLSVDDIAHGHHVCAVFDGQAVQQELVAEYVAAGLARRERVVYYTDDHSPDRVLGVLQAGGVSTAEPRASGQLVVVPAQDGYLSEQPFDPGRMIVSLHSAVDEALADGYSGFCATGELSWAPREAEATRRMIEYETRVGEVCATRPVMGLCQYNRTHFDQPLLDTLRALHGHAVRNPLVSEDELLRVLPLGSDERGNARLRVAGEADLSSSALLLDLIGGPEEGRGDLHLDLGRLRFVDVTGAEALGELAESLRASHRRLILYNAPVMLRRIVALVGSALPGLEMAAP